MTPVTPRWWYLRDRRHAPITRTLLKPLAWIWTWATARRIARAQPADPEVPVICVGNLTVGGAGKTPVAREIVRLLMLAGCNPQVLTRGHGGRLAGPVKVDLAVHTATQVGDEPLMLARDAPVWVALDRAAGAFSAAQDGADVIVMDDGHQNPSVKKTLSLVVVDGETRDDEWPFGDGSVMPAGPMREPLAAGLARADAVVVLLPADLGQADPDLLRLFTGTPVFIARLEPAAPPPAGPLVGFAGVGKPWKVERALVAAGGDLADFAPFADHAPYDQRTLAALADRAAALGARLVTTEKDWARLPAPWRERVASWPVRARFEDEAAVIRLLGAVR